MKEIKFIHLYLENFCGVKKLDTDLYDKTFIIGKNGVGKSTIKNAIYWMLFNKISDGSAPNGIRPHDENNQDIDNIEITVILTMKVDGAIKELKKVQKQKWTKHHGDTEKTFEGNINEFAINDIPKNEKSFKSYIDNIIPLSVFYDCTNSVSFFGLDTKKRRAKLMTLEDNVTNEEVIASNPQYKSLENELSDGTIDELILRSKQIIKKDNEKLKTIPTRIDEASKQKVDINVESMKQVKKVLKEDLKDIRQKLEDSSNVAKERSEKANTLMQLQFKLGDIKRDANCKNEKDRKEISRQIFDVEHCTNQLKQDSEAYKRHIEKILEEISERKEEKEKLAAKWKEEKTRQFDENSLICPYCGQEYPEEKKEKLSKDFENKKAKLLSDINERGKKCVEEIKKCQKFIDDGKIEFSHLEEEIKKCDMKKKSLEKELSVLPESIDVSESKEYKEIENQIKELEKEFNNKTYFDKVQENLKYEEKNILNRISEINEKFVLVEKNGKIDERIAELEEEQKNIVQQQANEQKKLDLLVDFNNERIKLLSEKVNSHFDILKFQLFRPLINGGTEDCCMALVNGTSYDGLLNTGNKILANIDICHAFQKKNNVKLPIIVDDTESLDTDKIPDVGSQMILLRRIDDKGLEIMEE